MSVRDKASEEEGEAQASETPEERHAVRRADRRQSQSFRIRVETAHPVACSILRPIQKAGYKPATDVAHPIACSISCPQSTKGRRRLSTRVKRPDVAHPVGVCVILLDKIAYDVYNAIVMLVLV
jgi:hypothetical protein